MEMERTINNLINKYIERIIIDYPERDKLHIDLIDFVKELDGMRSIEKNIEELNFFKQKQKSMELVKKMTNKTVKNFLKK